MRLNQHVSDAMPECIAPGIERGRPSLINIIFSKDRALQLDALLRALLHFGRDIEITDTYVLYTTSSELHQRQYETIVSDYFDKRCISFAREQDFRKDMLSLLQHYQFAAFWVDNNIVVRYFSFLDIIQALNKERDALGFSLRLGKNMTSCYPLNCDQPLPTFEEHDSGILKFRWIDAKGDFNLSLEVSSSVYRISEISPLLSDLSFYNPATMECAMALNRGRFCEKNPYLLCPVNSISFSNPINKPPDSYPVNRSPTYEGYSPVQLARIFDTGIRIDISRYSDFVHGACHQEVQLPLTLGAGLPVLDCPEKPSASATVPSYNRTNFVQHIKSAWHGNLSIINLVEFAEQLQSTGQLELAAVLYQTWLACNNTQSNHLVYFNLGVTLSTLEKLDAAKDAYLKAIELSPSFVLPHFNLGNIFEKLGQLNAAIDKWSWVLENTSAAKPDERSWRLLALNNLGRVLEIDRNYANAYEYLTESLRIEPNQPDVIHHWIFLRARQCMWPVYTSDAGIEMDLMRNSTSALAMIALSDDPATQLSAATNFVTTKVTYNVPALSVSRSYGHRKIRVAYLSSDFCVHPVSMLTVELFELHDRKNFEIYGLCWTKEDKSPLRQRIIQSMDSFYKIGELTDEAAAKLIREHEIDILVDLHGQTLGARPGLLAYRPAPIQITYLGLPGNDRISFHRLYDR